MFGQVSCVTPFHESGGEEAVVLRKATQIVQLQVHTYVAILRMPTELRLIRAYHGYDYGRTTATGTGVVLLRVRAYYDYGYGRTMTTATGILRLRLRAYDD